MELCANNIFNIQKGLLITVQTLTFLETQEHSIRINMNSNMQFNQNFMHGIEEVNAVLRQHEENALSNSKKKCCSCGGAKKTKRVRHLQSKTKRVHRRNKSRRN